MKVTFHKNKYYIRCAQRVFKDLLREVETLGREDVEHIARVSDDIKTLREEVKVFCDNLPIKINQEKLVAILADGVFTLKRSGKVTPSRRGVNLNTRMSRMLYNVDLARSLAIECHLKNKILENENDKTSPTVLGL